MQGHARSQEMIHCYTAMKNTSLAQRSQFETQSSSISKVNTTCPYTSTMYHYVLHGTCLCFFHWMGRQKHRRCPSTAKAKRIHSIAERLATDYPTQRERNSIWSILTPSSHGKKDVIRARVWKISANIAWLFQRGYCKGLSSLQDESSSRLRLRVSCMVKPCETQALSGEMSTQDWYASTAPQTCQARHESQNLCKPVLCRHWETLWNSRIVNTSRANLFSLVVFRPGHAHKAWNRMPTKRRESQQGSTTRLEQVQVLVENA